MKTKVFEALKPKAASLGFNKEELESAAEQIAGTLAQDATDDDIAKAIDSVLPYLKLSQSVYGRLVTAYKKEQSQNPNPTPAPAPAPAPTPTPTPSPEEKNEEPAWFKAYRESMESKLSEQNATIESLKKEKVSESLMAKALEQLNGVDKNYYELMLEGRTFETEEGMNESVTKIKSGWDKLCKERNIKALVDINPPAGGEPAPTEASEGVKARIAARQADAANQSSAIRGIPAAKQ